MTSAALPPEAALPIAAGLLAGIYRAVAAMAVLEFSMAEAVLFAVFLLIYTDCEALSC